MSVELYGSRCLIAMPAASFVVVVWAPFNEAILALDGDCIDESESSI